jgi:hypothetical protein
MVQDPAWRPWFGKPNVPDASFVTGTNLEVLRAFFPDVPPSLKPELRLVMGPVAAGKTRYRENECPAFVPCDPVDVYLALTDDGKTIPANIGELVERVGEDMIALAVKERRSLVIELIPTDDVSARIDDLIRAAKARRYHLTMAKLEVDNAEGKRRHDARPKTSISALHTQGDAIDWLLKAFYPGMAKKAR